MAAIAVLTSVAAATPEASETIQRRLDRYDLGRELGRGGMGMVYAARDTELGREVAIKILRPHASAARLRREAQVLAKLAHPNVVRIYDVGEHAGQVFIAMELVEGDTLRAWLASPRTRVQIIDVLLLAARGLVAAHHAGIVHRDFKPDNVFVGGEGQVLVGDFGLARSMDPEPSEDGAPATATASELDTGDPTVALTRTGAFVGTPAYTAPEQYRGGEVTGAADQFAFCVTAWEALYGARPFRGASVDEVREHIRTGTIERPPDRDVPARIEAALRRGLSSDPRDRFPSMAALVAAIAPSAKRRWPWIAGAAMVAATGTAAAFLLTQASKSVDCAATAELVSPVWNTSVAAELTRRSPSLADAFGRYVAHWQDQRVEACRATHERHEQTEELLERRIACLDHSRDILRITLGLVVDERAMPRFTNALDGLPSLERCRTASTADVPPPEQAFMASSLEAEITLLALRVQNGSGLDGRSLARIAEMRRQATALGFGPTLLALALVDARVAAWRGDNAAAEATLRETVIAAEAHGDDFTRARAMAGLARLLVDEHLEEASHLAAGARAALGRAGSDPTVEADVLAAEVEVARGHKDADHAADLQNRLIDLLRERYGDGGPVLTAYLDLSRVWLTVDRYDRASEATAKAEQIMRREFPGTTAIETLAMQQSTASIVSGDFEGARQIEAQRLTALRSMAHPTFVEAQAVSSFAQVEELAGNHASAVDLYREAIALWRRVLAEPPDGVLDISPSDLPALENDAIAGEIYNLFYLGRTAELVPIARTALAKLGTGNSRVNGVMASIQRTLARALVVRGECREARALIEPMLAATIPIPFTRGAMRFALARCLWDDGGAHDRERSVVMAADAAVDLDESMRANENVPSMRIAMQKIRDERTAVTAWRAAHVVP